MHIAEQRREVDECVTQLGKRPVAWLLDNVALDHRFSLVHAAHMDDHETSHLAKTGATVVLCPSTEGNLGDGFFPFAAYRAAGGRYAIGTDSHIGLSPLEEIRWLDYGQRLRSEKRNVVCRVGGEDSGRLLFDDMWQGGRLSMGHEGGAYFSVGQGFDAVILDADHPVIHARPPERRLAALIYAGGLSCFLGTMRRGRWLIKDGKIEGDVRTPFLRVLAELNPY